LTAPLALHSSRLAPRGRAHETAVLIVLAIVNGVVAFDRLAVNFLSPYILAELNLSNTQLGLLSSVFSIAMSGSGLLLSAIADAGGRQKRMLIVTLVAFSMLSAGSGLAIGFGTLVLARILLGLAEGPVVPLTQAVMASESAPARRGFNMGAMQICGGFLIGAALGPIVTTALAESVGWRIAFFASALPGFVAAFLVHLVLRRSRTAPAVATVPTPPADPVPIATLLRSRNLRLSMAIAGVFTAWLMTQNVFMPLYLVRVAGFTPVEMSLVLSASGIGGFLGGLLVPALSDRIGRRAAVIIFGTGAMLAPLAILYLSASGAVLAGAMVCAWIVTGCAPLVCATIPSESVPSGRVTTAVAMSMGSAEILGGVISPPIAGWLADSYDLRAPFIFSIGLALCCGLLALFLTETAPAVCARRRVD
jgi:MFS family permease